MCVEGIWSGAWDGRVSAEMALCFASKMKKCKIKWKINNEHGAANWIETLALNEERHQLPQWQQQDVDREREGGERERERRGVAKRRLSSSSWPPLWAIQQSVWFSPVFIFNTRQLKMLTWSGHNQVPREGWGWRCGCGWVVWCISLALLFVWITRDTHSQHSVFCAQLSFLCARLWLCCAVCAISVSAFHLLGI